LIERALSSLVFGIWSLIFGIYLKFACPPSFWRDACDLLFFSEA
jgi:hypothetical protein